MTLQWTVSYKNINTINVQFKHLRNKVSLQGTPVFHFVNVGCGTSASH